MEPTRATTADAEITLKLYDLRRESECRKARTWFGGEFWPQNFSEIEQAMMQYDSQQNHWLRQVLSYWDMAASLVVHGTYSPAMFYDTCGEGWFCFAKMKPFLNECRGKFSPEFLRNLETAINSTEQGRKRLQDMEQHIAEWGKMMRETRSKKQAATREAA